MAGLFDTLSGFLAGLFAACFGFFIFSTMNRPVNDYASETALIVMAATGAAFLLVQLAKPTQPRTKQETKLSLAHPATQPPVPATLPPTHPAVHVEGKKQCWNCRMWIPEIVTFCTSCGKPQGVAKQVVMVSCQFCNDLMPVTSVFCPNCGTKPTPRKRGVVIE